VSDIDKAVELARTFCDECVGGEGCTCDMCIIARAVLAMADVVAAARTWRAEFEADFDAPDSLAAISAAVSLLGAVATLDAEARRG
jgi:hypothetical protein